MSLSEFDKLPVAVFIQMEPNLDTTCDSTLSRDTFIEFFKLQFKIFARPIFLVKNTFLRPKMVKIQNFFSDMLSDI